MLPAPTTLLIIEDLPTTLDWLAQAAQAAFPEARLRTAGSVAESLAALAEAPAELLLLDLGLPDGSGMVVLEALRRDHPASRCVVTTIFDDDEHLFAALRLGASGYVLKDQSRDQLTAMLLAMQAGQPPLSPGVARRLLSHFNLPPVTVPAPANDGLTEREREVLQLVSKGYSVPQAAKAMVISPHTAHTHIKAVYRKLAVASRAEAVLAARHLGLA
ncbi:MAG: response regulator transcription factor [Stagnimonas sp.]|nr:response regulator transcription factor [Stagnimonas sp.]